jgi:hypothetical protein
MAVMDEAIKRFDFVDRDRLGVMGGSYGGYMTSWIVGHNDRFRAAISERAVNNLPGRGRLQRHRHLLEGLHRRASVEAPDAYRQMSPSTYAKDITTPLLILHSENDLRCPIAQGEDLFIVLRALRRRSSSCGSPPRATSCRDRDRRRTGWPASRSCSTGGSVASPTTDAEVPGMADRDPDAGSRSGRHLRRGGSVRPSTPCSTIGGSTAPPA